MKQLCGIILAVFFCVAAFGQAGVIVSGTTQDQTGAVIPGENVTLTNNATGQALNTQSDGQGSFSFTSVPPGDYVLKGEVQGFKAVEVQLAVRNRPLTDVAITMPIGDAEEVVDVSALSSQPTAADNNADAVQVNADLINSLPSQGQDILPVVSNFLSPAAQGPEGPSIVVDGIEGTDLNIPADSIRRININRNPYSPEFRRPGLGRVEITTRNGSRGHFDGSFAAYVRNDSLDARNAFAEQKAPLDRRLFEATLGGPFPVRHARFFVSASRLRGDESVLVNATTLEGKVTENVPTQQTNTNVLGRLDLRPNSANTISLVYSFHSLTGDNHGVGGLKLPSHQTSEDDRRHKGQIWYTTVISPVLLNVARFNYERRDRRDGVFPAAPEIDVKGEFIGGLNQSAETAHENKMEFQDILSYSRGIHTLRFGGAFRPRHFTVTDATNFGGTFTFPSLGSFDANSPELFQVVQGNPNLSFSRNEAYAFVQDDLRLGAHVSLMLGVRYDWQQRLADHNNVAPRAALAFSPGNGKTVFRAGGGIFYDRVPDSVTERTLLLDGANAREFIQKNPDFPNPSIIGVPPSLWVRAPDVQAPYLIQTSASMEQALWNTVRASVEYQYLRGVHLFRAVDLNEPLANGIRPDPNLFLVRQVQSTATLRSNSLLVSLQGRIAKPLKIKAQYTFSHSNDDSDGPFALPVESRNLGAEWGRSLFDVKHRFTLAGTSDLPHGLRLGALFAARSAPPFNITTGSDNNDNGIVNDRPAGVARNSGNGFGFVQLDLRLAKAFYILGREKAGKDASVPSFARLEVSVDAFNVFNHTNRTDVIGVTSAGTRFGTAVAAFQPRTIQLSIKVVFRNNRE